MKPADRVAIIALLVSIISLGITSYLSYFGIQAQKEIANLQATAQVQDIRLQEEVQNNNSLAHLELTNFSDGFSITNHGPAVATNINIILAISAVDAKWQKDIGNLNQIFITALPAASIATINEIHAPVNSSIFSNPSLYNAFRITLNSLAPGNASQIFVNFSGYNNVGHVPYQGKATLYTYPRNIPNSSMETDNFLENETYLYITSNLEIVTFEATASCNGCYFQYINQGERYFNDYLLVSFEDVGPLYAENAQIYNYHSYYIWKYDVSFWYLVPKGASPLKIPSSLYFADTPNYFSVCQPSDCVQELTH